MKISIIVIFIAIILSLSFSSCQKVINLELNSSSYQIVIQGNIYDKEGPYTVKISKSVNFDESSVYPPVSGATVKISDNHGNSEILTESDSGIYVTSFLKGTPGYTYKLTIIIGEITYTASSTMPDAVNIDLIYIKNSIFGNEKLVTLDFKDPANIDNYYRIIQFVNNIQQKEFNVTSDKIYQGKTISYSIMSQDDDNKLETGDYVTVWLECIDKGVYEYFRTAGSEGGQSASPSNPTSNISNGALGYFNACSVRKMSIRVP